MSRKYTLDYIKKQRSDIEILSTEYKDIHSKLKFKCICGNIYEMSGQNLLNGKLCRSCANKKQWLDRKITLNSLQEEFKTLKLISFNNPFIELECSNCKDIFKTRYGNLRNNMTCPKCSLNNRTIRTNKEVIQDNFKDITILEYIGSDELCKWQCNICGDIKKSYVYNLKTGVRGCKCTPKSKPEIEIYEWLCSLIPQDEIIRNSRSIIPPLELDFYIPKYSLAIEFNGTWFHSYNKFINQLSSKTEARNYHYNKTRQCEDKGIHLIHIWQHEWEDSNLKERIKSIIKADLNLTNNKIYARNCKIREVSQRDYKEFVNRLSMMGYRSAKYKYGLYYKDKLQMIMSAGFCQSGRMTSDVTKFEIIRSVTELDTIVVGGTSKLLKHLISKIKENYPNVHELIYYIDYDKHLGKSVEINAVFDKYTGPSCRLYCNRTCMLSNNKQEKILQKGNFYSRQPQFHKSVEEAIIRNDIFALYNSGTKRYHINI